MNLLQLVEAVGQGISVKEVVLRDTTFSSAEDIGIYMESRVSLTTPLAFFDLEQVPDSIFITVAGKQYEAFFSVVELTELIPEYASFLGAKATSLTIAEALISYYTYDA